MTATDPKGLDWITVVAHPNYPKTPLRFCCKNAVQLAHFLEGQMTEGWMPIQLYSRPKRKTS